MTIGELIIYLVVALLCGAVGQMMTGRSPGGFLVTTVIGLIGAIVGASIAHALKAPQPLSLQVGGQVIPIIWAIVGAIGATFFFSWLQRKRKSVQ